MDLARLGLIVDGSGAIRTLNQFTGSAHNAGRAGQNLQRTTQQLSTAFKGLAAYFGTRELIEYADTWTLINARINLVTDTQEQAIAIQQRLFEIAQRTRNSMAATSVLYTRTALNADQLGRSHEELLKMTEAVNAAMLVSGATGVESAQAMRQLAQALGSGRLQGDEFRTVMEAMPTVARAIADEMGVALGELYKLSREGKISVQVIIDALLKAHENLVERASEMPMTIGQSFVYFVNAAERMIGILNSSTGASGKVARAVKFVADNMDHLVAILGTLVAGLITYRATMIAVVAIQAVLASAQTIAAFLSLARAVRSIADAMALLRLVGKGVAGLLATIAAATVGFLAYRKILQEINEQTAQWEKSLEGLDDPLGARIDPIDEEAARKAKQTREEIEDMIRLAEQQVMLAGTYGRHQERMQIVMDAINKRVEARRDLEGELLQQMLVAIDRERDLLLQAEEIRHQTELRKEEIEELQQVMEQFAENMQRTLGESFTNILRTGLDSFRDLWNGVRDMFLRMLGDMLAAEAMKKFGARLAAALGGIFGGASPIVATTDQPTQTAQQIEDAIANGMGAVQLEAIIVDGERSFFSKFVQFLAPALAGFGVGSMIGGLTSNRVAGGIGGAMSGAGMGAAIGSLIPGVGTAAGAVMGGLAGALGGLISSSRRHREELERHRQTLFENNERLKDFRQALEGRNRGAELLGAGQSVQRLLQADALTKYLIETRSNFRNNIPGMRELNAIAEELGITLDGSMEAFEQLKEAIELNIELMTTFGVNLTDLQSKQEAYNKLFDIEATPQRALEDTFAILSQMAPELMREMGIANLNLTTEAGRTVLLEGLRDVFNMIASGELSPELLGAFTDKNQLLDAILRVKDALDEFHQELYKVTTDFPRAMDIAFYEQKFGRYGNSPTPNTNSLPNSGNGWVVNGGITIVNEAGDDGEVLLSKLEYAAEKKRSRGGYVKF